MEALFEILLEFICELLLQILGEILVELGLSSLAAIRKKPFETNPTTSFFGYILLGSLLGIFSYFPFPNSFIHSSDARILNLLASPLFVGMLMVQIGAKRAAKDGPVLRLYRFSYGFSMAFSFAFVRWLLVY